MWWRSLTLSLSRWLPKPAFVTHGMDSGVRLQWSCCHNGHASVSFFFLVTQLRRISVCLRAPDR